MANAAAADPVVARIGSVTVTKDQLYKPLIEAHGLSTLLNIVQLEMTRQEAAAARLTVSPGDIAAEEKRTLDRMFKDQGAEESQYGMLLSQFLERRNMGRGEWNMLMETNATLRKVVEPRARTSIKDEQLETAYKQLYGEKVQVRHIECSNLQEIGEAKRRLAAGEKFEDVARDMSRNARTAPLGGEVRAFTRNSGYPASFTDAAFALKNKGDISDPVQAENGYHLIQLTERIAPKVIKFEDVKASIREDLEEGLIQSFQQELRQQLSERASRQLQIVDPSLKQQYADEQSRRQQQIRDRDEIRKELERQREKAATQQAIPDLPPAPSDTPATQPKP